jgi:hypothetical protein
MEATGCSGWQCYLTKFCYDEIQAAGGLFSQGYANAMVMDACVTDAACTCP